jgi:uncharacterized protein YuzE
MEKPKIKYDETSDTLSVVFESGAPSTGIELTNNILLRVNSQTREAASLEFFDYSILAQATDIGTRSFPFTGLNTLSKQLQEDTLRILHNQPVCDFLQLSAYTPSITETIPILLIKPGIIDMTSAA